MSVRKSDRDREKVARKKRLSTLKVFGIVAVLLVGLFAISAIHPALADDTEAGETTAVATQDEQATPSDNSDDKTNATADSTEGAASTGDESSSTDAAAGEDDPASSTGEGAADAAAASGDAKQDAVADDAKGDVEATDSTTASDDLLTSSTVIPAVTVKMNATVSNYDMREGLMGFSLVLNDSKDTSLGTASVAADGSISITTDKLNAAELQALIKSGQATAQDVNGSYVITVPCRVIEDTTQLAGSGISCQTTNAALAANITITVPKSGAATTSVSYPDGTTFENSYSTNDAYLNMYGAKLFVVNGATVTVPADVNGKFTFKLTASDGAPLPKKYGTDKTCTSTTNEVGNSLTYNPIDFGEITFTDADLANVARSANGSKSITYTYTVTEEPNSDTSYMPFNSSETIKVTLTDNGSGRLIVSAENESEGTAFVTMNDDNALEGDTSIVIPGSSSTGGLFSFTNMYSEGSTTATIEINKALDGRDLKAGEFKFSLLQNGTVIQTAENAADGSVKFQPISYSEAGTTEYTIQEVKGTEDGVTYSTDDITATVTVTENKDTGVLSTKVTYSPDDPTITNTYTAKAVQVDLAATKTITGKDLEAGEFSFELIDPSGKVVQTVTNAADGSVAFDSVSIDKPGTYTYTIQEVRGDETGVTYDSTPVKATFTVTQDSATGTLSASDVTYTPDATFSNTFKAGTVQADFAVTKVLTGKTLEDGEFSFQLIGPDGVVDQTVTNAADGTVDFAAVNFDKAGTYTYTIKEVKGTESGVTYDDSTITATVIVSQNAATGELETPVVTYSSTNPTFTNTFASSAIFSAAATVNADKTLDGAAQVAGEFKFELTPADDASAALLGATTFQNNSGAAGKAVQITTATGETLSQVLGGVKFTNADAGNTYSWTLKEVGAAKTGYTLDSTVHTISVKVSTDASGATILDVTVDGKAAGETGSAQATAISFTNTYAAATENAVVIKAEKSLTGTTMTDGQFRFTLTDATGDIVSDTTNTADGTVEFKPISYTWDECLKAISDGDAVATTVDGKSAAKFTYTVAEDTEHLETGYSATRKGFSVTVTVVNDGDGTLSTQISYPENTTLTNVYSTSDAYVYITGRKVVKTDESGLVAPDVTGKYTFTITGEDGAPMPETTTATNDASGTVEFGPIKYTLDGLDDQETRTYVYYVTESGEVPGVANDTSTHKVEVTVENKGNGKLTAIITNDEGEFDEGVADFTFTNTYSVVPVRSGNRATQDAKTLGGTSVAVGLAKQLEGRDMKAGEFTFELVDPQGKVVSSGTNAADGIISMSEVTFDQPGTFVFTLHEVKGDLPGVTYDTKTYTCTAVVTDNGNGTLSVAWSIAGATFGSDLVFHNTYEAAATTATVQATKTLTGRDLKAGEFTFELVDSEGNVVSTAKNTASGDIVFDTLNFSAAGTYTYTIKEVKGDETGVDYDANEFTATVTVTDDTATGKLVASDVVYSATPAFTNTFTASAVEATLGVTKTLTGETLAAGQFGFQLTDPLGRVVQTVRNDAAGAVTFAPVSFTKAGTYVYTITEMNEGAKGVTYDATPIKATVVVSQDAETGELTVESVTYSPKAEFANTYKAETVKTDDDKKLRTDETSTTASKSSDLSNKATTSAGKASATRNAKTSVKTTTKTTTTPKTADATLFAPMTQMAAAGAALVAGAAFARRKHRK